ncbi:MAG: hypothetical protein QXU52_05615 [Fervidicoccaceae archaeon]
MDRDFSTASVGDGLYLSYDVPPLVPLERRPAHPLYITDTTLRDGQQGWRPLRPEEALKIYFVLEKLSGPNGIVRTVELFPFTERDREIAKTIIEHRAEWPEPIGWIRAKREDVDLVRRCGFDHTVILTSVSDYHIYLKLNLDRKSAEEKFLEAISYALDRGLKIRVAMEDVTRSDVLGFVLPFAEKILRVAERVGAVDSVVFKLSDTLGLGLPMEVVGLPRGVPALIKAFRERLGVKPTQLEFHGHNDFHMAVANHAAAWLSGASFSNCTLFGVGERAGNCPLEAMLLIYASIYGSFNGSDPRAIGEAKELFESLGHAFSRYYPLVGENAFATAAGIHIDGLIKNPLIYLPFNPETIGMRVKVRVSRHSGRAGIAYVLARRLGLDPTALKRCQGVIDKLYELALEKLEAENRVELSEEEVYSLALEAADGRLLNLLRESCGLHPSAEASASAQRDS